MVAFGLSQDLKKHVGKTFSLKFMSPLLTVLWFITVSIHKLFYHNYVKEEIIYNAGKKYD